MTLRARVGPPTTPGHRFYFNVLRYSFYFSLSKFYVQLVLLLLGGSGRGLGLRGAAEGRQTGDMRLLGAPGRMRVLFFVRVRPPRVQVQPAPSQADLLE